jgi:hypothetical protein
MMTLLLTALFSVTAQAGTTYTLRVVNQSSSFENFAVYQSEPDLGRQNTKSLLAAAPQPLPVGVAVINSQIDVQLEFRGIGRQDVAILDKSGKQLGEFHVIQIKYANVLSTKAAPGYVLKGNVQGAAVNLVLDRQ